ncbi:hypothetical protein O181_073414 [Austropuccinia psidii MF-1]|uniref:Uncharacterized protein n=1 Tax=Austropuccinia psidii MF-1 TaxID=1389203 RepID=A0A9Q3F6M4_9BASI|nr:hypothetical protein [Austropuccinia psidii MF-1]
MGPLCPFWPKSNEAKRGQGLINQHPNHKWAHLSHFWPQNPTNPELAKTTLRPKIDQEPQNGHNSVHGLWQPPEATSSAPSKDSPKAQGKTFPSSMHPVLKDPGVVHIWYNIPLCTIFAQQSNGDIFRNKLHDSKSIPQSFTNFKGGCFGYSFLQFPGSYQRTIRGPQPPGPAGVGLSILIRTILREILRGYNSFKLLSRFQVFSIPGTTQLVHTGSNQASCMALAHLSQFIFHYGNSVTQFNSQYGQNCIGPIQTIQPGDSPSRISLSAFHIYWPPFLTLDLFPQLINILDLSLLLFFFHFTTVNTDNLK